MEGRELRAGAGKWQDEEKFKSGLIIVRHKLERRGKGLREEKLHSVKNVQVVCTLTAKIPQQEELC